MPDQGTAFSMSPWPGSTAKERDISDSKWGAALGRPPFASLLFNPFGHGSIVIVQV